MTIKDRQYRHFNFECREKSDDGKMIVRGVPIVFDKETVLWEYDGIQYKEKIDPGALNEADMSEVILNIDHRGKPAAKIRNNTLMLDIRPDGLYIEADLSQNATGRELYEDIQKGFYDKMSFSFIPKETSYNRETRTKTILKIEKLYDVSAVSFPAYDQTELSARSWVQAQHEAEIAEKRAMQATNEEMDLIKSKIKLLGEI